MRIFSRQHTLFPARQSAYRRFHSTKTAIAAVNNDLLRAADADQGTALVLLDFSSAFDTVDHDILLSVLERRFGVDGVCMPQRQLSRTGGIQHITESVVIPSATILFADDKQA